MPCVYQFRHSGCPKNCHFATAFATGREAPPVGRFFYLRDNPGRTGALPDKGNMADSKTIAAMMLGGGLAGALLTQLAQHGITWLRRPKLSISFGEEVPGCVVDNVPYTAGNRKGRRKFFRLRVENTGCSAATDTELLVERVCNRGRWQFDDEVMSLLWSNSKNNTKVSIPSNTHRYVDLLSADLDPNEHSPTLLAEGYDFDRFRTLGVEGVIEIDVCVTASNAATFRKALRITSDGTAAGSRIILSWPWGSGLHR